MSSMLARAQSSSLDPHGLVLLVLLPPHWPLLLSPLPAPGPWDSALANNSRPWHHSTSMPVTVAQTSLLTQAPSTPLPLSVSVWVSPQHVQSGLLVFPQPTPHTVILIAVGGDSAFRLLRPNAGCGGAGGGHPRLLLPPHIPHLILQQAPPGWTFQTQSKLNPICFHPPLVLAAILSHLDLAATSLLASLPPHLRLLEGRSEYFTPLRTSLRVKANVL